jgi:hypothetical protein
MLTCKVHIRIKAYAVSIIYYHCHYQLPFSSSINEQTIFLLFSFLKILLETLPTLPRDLSSHRL